MRVDLRFKGFELGREGFAFGLFGIQQSIASTPEKVLARVDTIDQQRDQTTHEQGLPDIGFFKGREQVAGGRCELNHYLHDQLDGQPARGRNQHKLYAQASKRAAFPRQLPIE